jgi:hypothetical protein
MSSQALVSLYMEERYFEDRHKPVAQESKMLIVFKQAEFHAIVSIGALGFIV